MQIINFVPGLCHQRLHGADEGLGVRLPDYPSGICFTSSCAVVMWRRMCLLQTSTYHVVLQSPTLRAFFLLTTVLPHEGDVFYGMQLIL